MPNKLENDLKDAFDALCPDVFDDILSECDKKKGSVTMINYHNNRRTLRAVLIAAAAVILAAVLCIGGAFLMRKPDEPPAETTPIETTPAEPVVAAKVYIDVNPSVEIALDEEKTVLSVSGINSDGRALLKGEDFVGEKVETAVKGVVELTVRDGYLNETNSALLLTVDSKNETLKNELCTTLSETVNDLLKDELPEAKVTVNALEQLTAIDELCQTYGVSPGKATQIVRILAASDKYTTESLLKATVNELLSICEGLGLSTVSHDIGIQEAIRIVTADAGVSKQLDQLRYWNAGSSDTILLYELSFVYGDRVYFYAVNAATGEIVEKHTDPVCIDKNTAFGIALQYLGLEKEDLDFYLIDYSEHQDSNGHYLWRYHIVRIQKDNAERSVVIDAVTGAVLDVHENEIHLYPQQIRKIVYDDAGLSYYGRYPGDEEAELLPSRNGSMSSCAPYNQLYLVSVELNNNENAVYIIDDKTGEILFKEITDNSVGYSLEEAIAIATIAAKYNGAEECETLDVKFGNYILVTIREDGKVFQYQISNGLIRDRKATNI